MSKRLSTLQSNIQKRPAYPWLVFFSVVLGCVMVNVDSSILNVAVPTFEQVFATDAQHVQWVITAYLLVVTGLLPGIGKLSDLRGRKPIFLAGIALFSISSVLCAVAASIDSLIVFRILQAIGGAMIMGNMMPIIASTFSQGQRGKAMGGISSVIAVSTIIGPPLGGFLISYSSWRAIFWVNLPIGVLSCVTTWLLLPRHQRAAAEKRFDWIGAGTFFLAMAALILYVSNGMEWGFMSGGSWACLLTSVVAWTLFIWWQGKTAEPMLDLSVFRIPTFTIGNVTGYFGFLLTMVPSITLPLFMDHVLHAEVHEIGLVMAAQAIATTLISPLSGWLTDKIGARWLVLIGTALTVAGLGMMTVLNAHTTIGWIIAALWIQGIGIGAFQSPNNLAVLESVPPEKMGVIGGIMATVRNFGRVSGASFSILVMQLMTINGNADAGATVKGVYWVFSLSALLGVLSLLLSVLSYWSPGVTKRKSNSVM